MAKHIIIMSNVVNTYIPAQHVMQLELTTPQHTMADLCVGCMPHSMICLCREPCIREQYTNVNTERLVATAAVWLKHPIARMTLGSFCTGTYQMTKVGLRRNPCVPLFQKVCCRCVQLAQVACYQQLCRQDCI